MTERREGGVTIFDLAGQIEAQNLPTINGELDRVLGTGRVRICFNCSGIESPGLTAAGAIAKDVAEMVGEGRGRH